MAEILVITHQLTRTGAPIVLFDMVKVLLGAGHHVDMISMLDGFRMKKSYSSQWNAIRSCSAYRYFSLYEGEFCGSGLF